MTDDERVGKLPKWAQEMLRGAEARATAAEARLRVLTEGSEPADTFLADAVLRSQGGAYGQGLGIGPNVLFGRQGERPLFTVCVRDGVLSVYTGQLAHQLRIHPVASNRIDLEAGR